MSRLSTDPSPSDDLQQAFHDAVQDYRAEVQRCLLRLAYAWHEAPAEEARDAPDPPDRASSDARMAADDHPLVHASTLAPADREPCAGTWEEALRELSSSAPARRLRALGVDADILALAEVRRMEGARIGPAHGLLRPAGGDSSPDDEDRSPAWHALVQALHAQTPPPWQRASDQCRHHATRLSRSMQDALAALVQDLLDHAARAGVPLDRLAAAEGEQDGSFAAPAPAPVAGAPSWGVTVRADPTIDGSWMVVAQRVRLDDAPAPAPAPAVVVILRVHGRNGVRERRQHLAAEDECVTWYEDEPLGSAPVLRAELAGEDGHV